MMNRAVDENKLSISIYGKRSSGKSRLMNNIIGQDVSVVSKVKGTTTDPVAKEVEFGKLGHVLFTDTAGIDDYGVVGAQRVKKTMDTLGYTDLDIYVMDSEDIDEREYRKFTEELERCEIPHILVFNKVDKVPEANVSPYRKKYRDALFMSAKNFDDISKLKRRIESELSGVHHEGGILDGLVGERDEVLLVVSRDYREGRSNIFLGAEAIKDALKKGAIATVLTEDELGSIRLDRFSLTVADDSAYESVESKVSEDMRLTTFSMLLLRKKRELSYFVDSAKKLDSLEDGDKVLIYGDAYRDGSCRDEEKIIKAISGYCKKRLSYEQRCGVDFPEEMEGYSFIVCNCIFSDKPKLLAKMIKKAKSANVPISDYAVVEKQISGELDRVTKSL